MRALDCLSNRRIIFWFSKCVKSWSSKYLRDQLTIVLIASSVLLHFLYANCHGSNLECTSDFRRDTIYFSKHFISTEIKATSVKSLFCFACDFFGYRYNWRFLPERRDYMQINWFLENWTPSQNDFCSNGFSKEYHLVLQILFCLLFWRYGESSAHQ